MAKYAYGTDVPVTNSKAEIEKTLTRFGADQFMIGWQTGNVKSPLGDIINGVCYAYKWSVLRWREFNRAAQTDVL